MIDAKRIAVMKGLIGGATPGPWKVEISRYEGSYNAASVDDNYDLPACLMRINNAMLVTESRQFVPDIIAAYEAQAEEITKLREALSDIADGWRYMDERTFYNEATKTAEEALAWRNTTRK